MRTLKSNTVVVKIGTSSLTYANGKMNYRRIEKLVMVLSDLKNQGKNVVWFRPAPLVLVLPN